MNRTLVLAAIFLSGTAQGCGGDDVDSSDVAPRVTYSGEIRALVETNCSGCHFAGGPAPFSFETYEEVSAVSSAMLDAITSGRMPPWPADPSCRTYANERRLSPDDITTFEAWLDEGAPEGEPTEPIAVTPTELEATHTFSASAPYTPDFSAEGDDYRCFLLDADFDAPAWVQGSAVSPATAAVHHVLVYALDASQAARAETLDAAEEGEGYTCFGGPLPGAESEGMMMDRSATQVTQLAGWVPGSEPTIISPDTGIPIDAGSRVVMQIHYSAVGGESVPDQTQLQLRMTDTPPQSIMRTVPLAIPELDIPAGEDDVTFTSTLTNWSDRPVTIVRLTGHMHLLGKSISAYVEHANGEQSCGLAIPQWDFDWQLSYDLPEQERLTVAPGDGVVITCSYDNTAENQQVIDGQQVDPRDVQWGEGSLDEMCLIYANVVEPYQAPAGAGEGACAAASECFGASDGSLTGLLGCESASSACTICALETGTTCGLTPCLLALSSARECITECIISTTAFGGPLGRCLEATCGETYDELTSCADPIVLSGACDEALSTACGLGGGG